MTRDERIVESESWGSGGRAPSTMCGMCVVDVIWIIYSQLCVW
jgi:hypothetical protein